jgi:catechol 2,3-dioxygenase-like lactoylglutathione lyase family enzyme
MKFGHMGIKVLDIDKSLKFYEEVLEAKVIKNYEYPNSRLVFLEVGGTIIELISKADNEARTPGPIEHIAFKVENLKDRMIKLDDLGVEYTEPRQVGSAEIIFIKGPNNEQFEFVARVTG